MQLSSAFRPAASGSRLGDCLAGAGAVSRRRASARAKTGTEVSLHRSFFGTCAPLAVWSGSTQPSHQTAAGRSDPAPGVSHPLLSYAQLAAIKAHPGDCLRSRRPGAVLPARAPRQRAGPSPRSTRRGGAQGPPGEDGPARCHGPGPIPERTSSRHPGRAELFEPAASASEGRRLRPRQTRQTRGRRGAVA